MAFSMDQTVPMPLDASTPVLHTIGNYDLLEKIGEGGMGTVYKGRQRQTGQIVAVEVVPPNLVLNKVLMQRFEKEARVASTLDHPNIIRALEYGIEAGSPYLVMEFVEGESLGQRLERDGRIPEAEAIRIICLAAQGLHYAHQQGMIHRDVKPDNIMVTRDGQVKLADLGLVKEMETDINLTRTGRGLGTPHFMAPEQFRNAKNADARCDIYSLAATLYMMVTNELPFRSMGPLDAWMKKLKNDLTPVRQVCADLSERVDMAIQRAMNAEPQVRPSSCLEFINDLKGQGDPGQDLWYLVYKDGDGVTHTSKGSTTGIRRSLKEGLLGNPGNVRICRTKSGPFHPIRSRPEFRDMCDPGAEAGAPEDPGLPTHTAPYKILPASGARIPPPVVTDTSSDSEEETSAPHIRLDTAGFHTPDWLKVLLTALLAMIIGLVVILYFK